MSDLDLGMLWLINPAERLRRLTRIVKQCFDNANGWRFDQPAGSGNQGVCYKVTRISDGRQVVVKMFNQNGTDEDNEIKALRVRCP